jgi:hypothetical protein
VDNLKLLMANLDNFHILPEQRELFEKSVVVRDGFFGTKADKKNIVYRKRNFVNLIAQSNFPDVAERWNALPQSVKDRWAQAGEWSFQSGWDLFAQDTNYRVANGILGVGEANIFHQFKVGHIHIESPATAISIYQTIFAPFDTFFDMSINYCNRLVSTGAGSYAKMFLNIYVDEEWTQYWTSEELDLTDSGWWDYVQDSYDFEGVTILQMYVSIEIHNMTGDFFFDGVSLIRSDVNLLNDYNCNNIENIWRPVSVPVGASFKSVYSQNKLYQE